MNIKDFTYFLLATLANKSEIITLRDRSIRTISFPVNYKQRIQNIMFAGASSWPEKFSVLIDTQEYFDNHFAWEVSFAAAVQETLKELEKAYKYDFINDRLLIQIKQDQVNDILGNYKNKNLISTMDHFANLFVDYMYTREAEERFHNHSAVSIEKAKKLHEEKIKNSKPAPISKL